MALRNDLSGKEMLNNLVMSNTRLWTFRTNPAQGLTAPAATRLAEVTCPTLVILGGQDLPHIKDIARLLVEGITRATLITIPSAGHIANLDAPETFNQALESFLAEPRTQNPEPRTSNLEPRTVHKKSRTTFR